MALSLPSFVSPTTGLTEPTASLPGWARVHVISASAGLGHGQGVGEDDGGLDLAQLLKLGGPHHLAKPIAHGQPRRHLVLKQIAPVGQNRRHPRADIVAGDQRNLPHPHPRHIGDGVERARGEYAGSDAQFTGAEWCVVMGLILGLNE